MYKVKYIGTYKSMDGKSWTIEILDRDLAIDQNIPFTVFSGAEISLSGQTLDANSRIAFSQCTFQMTIRDDDGTEDILDILKNFDEFRLALRVSFFTVGIKFTEFIGFIQNDGTQIPNEFYPYPLVLNAVDLLKSLEGRNYYEHDRKNIVEHLVAMLSGDNGVNELFFDANEIFLICLGNWYESEFGTGNTRNVWRNVYFRGKFGEQNEDGSYKEASVFQAIEQICELMDARFFMRRGAFYIEQINSGTKATVPLLQVRKDASVILEIPFTRATFDIDQDQVAWKAGSFSRFLPALSRVQQTAIYSANENLIQITPENVNNQQLVYFFPISLGLVTANNDQPNTHILFDFSVNITIYKDGAALTQFIPPQIVRFKGTIKVGDYYLKSTPVPTVLTFQDVTFSQNISTEWVTTPTEFELEILTPYGNSLVPAYWEKLTMLTEKVPAGGVLTFQFRAVEVFFPGDNTTETFDTPPTFEGNNAIYRLLSNTDYEYHIQMKPYITIRSFDDDLNELSVLGRNGRRITSENNTSKNTKIYEATINIAEGPISNENKIYVFNQQDQDIVPSGYDWGIESPDGLTIHQLAVNEIMNRNRKSIRAFFGTLICRPFFDALRVFNYRGVKYIVNRSTYFTALDEVDVELIELDYDFVAYDGLDEIDVNEEVFERMLNDRTVGRKLPFGGSNEAAYIADGFLSEEIFEGNAIDEIEVNAGATVSMQEGESAYIINSIDGSSEKITLRSNYQNGDATMDIVLQTFNNYFPSRSFIFRDKTSINSPSGLFRRYSLLQNQTGATVTPTFDLPDVSTWTDAQIRERFHVYRSTAKQVYNLGFSNIDPIANTITFTPSLRGELIEIIIL
jgi:hypothetical protein